VREYIYKEKKFNARKETVDGEDYYGIKIFRFYITIKWSVLSSFYITLVSTTRPPARSVLQRSLDYAAEHDTSRNVEP
jgi:hypothetical protein